MTHVRKTRDYYSIQQYTGSQYGWEEVCAEDTWREARARLKEYRENQPEYPVRARLHRERMAYTFRGVAVLPADRNSSGIRWSARLNDGAVLRADTARGIEESIRAHDKGVA